jgi:hypothetical protein
MIHPLLSLINRDKASTTEPYDIPEYLAPGALGTSESASDMIFRNPVI